MATIEGYFMALHFIDILQERVVKARSFHGAIAAIVIGLMLTLLYFILFALSEDISLIWLYSDKIVGLSGVWAFTYIVIRSSDLVILKLEKDWGIVRNVCSCQKDNGNIQTDR